MKNLTQIMQAHSERLCQATLAINDLPKLANLKRLFPQFYRAAPVLVAAARPAN